MIILWVNIRVWSLSSWNVVFGTMWFLNSSWPRFRPQVLNPVGLRPDYQIHAEAILTACHYDICPVISPGRGRHWNFDPPQCLGSRPEILDRYISLSCLRWLPTACHERLAYFHWSQWVTWLVTWWVTWSRSPDAGRHIGKFSLWTTLLRFSRSAQISLFSNFTNLGQLFLDNIFLSLTS